MYAATMGRGFGDAVQDYQIGLKQTSQNIQVGGSMAAGVGTAIASSIAAAGGSVLGISSAALSAAVPFIGPALMGATLLVQYLVANSGCGQTCIETSQWANQAAAALQQVLDGYFALPAPRTKTQQALALANFDTIWAQLQQACGQSGTGDAGKRCISDRQRGACVWKQNQTPGHPGEPAIGECWNWFVGYRDPIANDPVVPDPVDSAISSVTNEVSSLFGNDAGSASWLPLALVGGLVLWAVAS